MKALEEKILRDGKVYEGDVLKVDSFLNHRIDVAFMNEIGREFARVFKGISVDKIVTIEASGIGIACIAAQYFGNCPVVFAKKSKTSNISDRYYASKVHSYTHGVDSDVVLSKEYLAKGDRVLILDDFLASGSAVEALLDVCAQAGAEVLGVGIVIEKAFQPGGQRIRERGIRVESLARIASMSPADGVTFVK